MKSENKSSPQIFFAKDEVLIFPFFEDKNTNTNDLRMF